MAYPDAKRWVAHHGCTLLAHYCRNFLVHRCRHSPVHYRPHIDNLSVARDETAIKDAYRRMGWRLYVTNAPLTRLSLQQAVRVYRGGVATISNPFAMLRHYPHFKTVFCNC